MRFQHTGGKLYARNMPCMEEVRERGTFRASNAYSLFVTTRLGGDFSPPSRVGHCF